VILDQYVDIAVAFGGTVGVGAKKPDAFNVVFDSVFAYGLLDLLKRFHDLSLAWVDFSRKACYNVGGRAIESYATVTDEAGECTAERLVPTCICRFFLLCLQQKKPSEYWRYHETTEAKLLN